MVAGDLELTVGDETLEFEPPSPTCPDCGDAGGWDHAVELSGTAPGTMAVSVTFQCCSCGEVAETATQPVGIPAGTGDGPGGQSGELLDWIEGYVDEEGRPPSKTACVQSAPFDVLEAQELLDDLVRNGWVEETEQLRATNKVTVYRPV